ncbi:hypothetical protein ACWDF9_26530 [Streptomyces rubiginosohelvolus]
MQLRTSADAEKVKDCIDLSHAMIDNENGEGDEIRSAESPPGSKFPRRIKSAPALMETMAVEHLGDLCDTLINPSSAVFLAAERARTPRARARSIGPRGVTASRMLESTRAARDILDRVPVRGALLELTVTGGSAAANRSPAASRVLREQGVRHRSAAGRNELFASERPSCCQRAPFPLNRC